MGAAIQNSFPSVLCMQAPPNLQCSSCSLYCVQLPWFLSSLRRAADSTVAGCSFESAVLFLLLPPLKCSSFPSRHPFLFFCPTVISFCSLIPGVATLIYAGVWHQNNIIIKQPLSFVVGRLIFALNSGRGLMFVTHHGGQTDNRLCSTEFTYGWCFSRYLK